MDFKKKHQKQIRGNQQSTILTWNFQGFEPRSRFSNKSMKIFFSSYYQHFPPHRSMTFTENYFIISSYIKKKRKKNWNKNLFVCWESHNFLIIHIIYKFVWYCPHTRRHLPETSRYWWGTLQQHSSIRSFSLYTIINTYIPILHALWEDPLYIYFKIKLKNW